MSINVSRLWSLTRVSVPKMSSSSARWGFRVQTSLQVPDQVWSLISPMRHTESPLACCRSVSCTLPRCTYLSQLVPVHSFASPRGQIVSPDCEAATCQSTTPWKKLCLCSWVSDKNVRLIYEGPTPAAAAFILTSIYYTQRTNFTWLLMMNHFSSINRRPILAAKKQNQLYIWWHVHVCMFHVARV